MTTITIIVLSTLLLVAVFFLGRVAYISGRRATTICNLKSKSNATAWRLMIYSQSTLSAG